MGDDMSEKSVRFIEHFSHDGLSYFIRLEGDDFDPQREDEFLKKIRNKMTAVAKRMKKSFIFDHLETHDIPENQVNEFLAGLERNEHFNCWIKGRTPSA